MTTHRAGGEDVYVWIILVGSGLLILLAVLAGVASRPHARDWQGIAERRRANWEEEQRLAAIVETLIEEAGTCRCPVCRRIRWLSGRDGGPQDLTP
jgi:hypothetical protein